MNGLGRFLVFGAVIMFLASASFAETTCTVGDCEITITLKIAFSGANDTYINNAENEIENTWNGPDGFRTVGDCKCKMKIEVETKKAADCKNNPPAGYHCIMVTDYNNNPPRNQTNWTGAKFYIGYMYGIATGNGGNSQKGWWSDIMSRPVNASNPQGEHYKDFAHEAGHMMGLEDCDGGIMCRTSGNNSDPTQANLDEIANDMCGPNACPDRCCCGNGEIDRNKGEKCDPLASPDGCGTGQACCPVCCNCYGPVCIPANGEYVSQSACQAACGPDSSCYKNYKTGCWDCVRKEIVVEETCLDPTNIRGNLDCDHTVRSFAEQVADFYETDLVNAPVLGGIFSDERINIKTEEGDAGYIITEEGQVTDYSDETIDDSTVTIHTDRETIGLIASEQLSVQQALSEGMIRIQGDGFFNGIRFGIYNFMFGLYNFFSPAEGFVPPEEEPDFPQGYHDAMEEVTGAEPAPEETMGHEIGDLPDGGYFGSDVFPS
jgi:hypothetical protein